jgi:hypothetical protein
MSRVSNKIKSGKAVSPYVEAGEIGEDPRLRLSIGVFHQAKPRSRRSISRREDLLRTIGSKMDNIGTNHALDAAREERNGLHRGCPGGQISTSRTCTTEWYQITVGAAASGAVGFNGGLRESGTLSCKEEEHECK